MRRRGSNAVEFALTLPILLVLFSGIVDFSYWMLQHQAVVEATREGARVGALTEPDTTAVLAACTATATATLAEMNITGTTPACVIVTLPTTGDQAVEATVDHTFTALVGFKWYGMAPTPPTNIKSVVTMRTYIQP